MIYRNGEVYFNAHRALELIERVPVTSGGLPIDDADVLYMGGWNTPPAFVSIMVKRKKGEPLNLDSIFEEAWRQVEAGLTAQRVAVLKAQQPAQPTQQATGEEGV